MKQFNTARFLYKLYLHMLFNPLSHPFILFIKFFNKIFDAQASESTEFFLDICPYPKLLLDSLILHLHIVNISECLPPHIIFISSQVAIS
jgi:hypothetical protein